MTTPADPPVPVLPAAPRRFGRPSPRQRLVRTLSREAVVDAALAVLDADGLAAVTMRRVAEELGTGPASLYAHVADKDEMVEAVLDRVIGEVEIPDPIDSARWAEQLKDLARSARAAFGRHRDIARASLGAIPVGERALPVTNAMVGVLLAGGVSPRVAALSVDILALYFTATAFEESLDVYPTANGIGGAAGDAAGGPAGGAAGGTDPDAVFHHELRRFFAGLPADRFPYLVAMAGPLTTGDGDERFEFGLDLLVRGIASTVTPAPDPD